jgi:hypothetical protein
LRCAGDHGSPLCGDHAARHHHRALRLDPQLKLIVPLAFVLLGARGLFVGEKLGVPRWYGLLWFGFATFMMLNVAGVPAARAAEEAAEVAAAV